MASKRTFDGRLHTHEGGGRGKASNCFKRPRRTASDPKERVRAHAEAKMSEVLSSLMKHKHAGLFLTPVDPSTAPGYENYVRTPMDLGTIAKKLKAGGFAGDIRAFTAQVRLVFANCLAYNPPGDWARAWGESCGGAFEAMYNAKLAPLLAESEMEEESPDAEGSQDDVGARGAKSKKLKVKLKKGGAGMGSGHAAMRSSKGCSLPRGKQSAPALDADTSDADSSDADSSDADSSDADSSDADPPPKKQRAASTGMRVGANVKDGRPGGKALPKIRITFNAIGAPKIASPRAGTLPSISGPTASPKTRKATIKIPPLRISPPGAAQQGDGARVNASGRRTRSVGGDLDGGHHGAGVLKLPPRARSRASSPASTSLGRKRAEFGVGGEGDSVEEDEGAERDDDMNEQEKEVSTEDEELVRKNYVKQAKRLFRKTTFPFRSGPYEVTSFGLISVRPEFHYEDFIFPPGFRCTHSRFLRALSKQYPGRRLVVRCDSSVVERDGSPRFHVEHCGQLLAEATSGLEAWHAAMQLDRALARRIVFRLVRCKAVLNRLCCSSDIMAFLEAVRPEEVPTYHSKILRPMHMRVVKERLARGGYLNEFAFASDIRLAWSNAKLFNREGSDLWMAADRLSSEFESLFCAWVINPPDGFGRGTQGNAPAQGPWDDWQHLRYFDPFDDCKGCSKASKSTTKPEAGGIDVEGADGAMGAPELVCSSCEDGWHAACLGAAAGAAATTASLEGRPFMCPRCTAWANAGGTEGLRGMARELTPPPVGAGSQARADTVAVVPWTPQFYPHSSLPAGFQLRDDPPGPSATATTTAPTPGAEVAGLEAVAGSSASGQAFLTPVGTVVVGLAAAETYAKAYQARVTSDQKAKGGAKKRDVVFTMPGQEGEDSSYYLVVAGMDRVAGSVDPAESGAGLGPDGHFGLSVPEIKIRIEGLPSADQCERYVFKGAARQQKDAEIAARQRSEGDEALQAVRSRLRSRLAEERWYWVRRRQHAGEERNLVSRVDTHAAAMDQAVERRRKDALAGIEAASVPESSMELVPPTLGDPKPLFSRDLALSSRTVAVEQALMAWNFLSSFRDLLGFVLPPARRMIDALTPPKGKAIAIPSPSELTFSETGMVLTKLLLVEVHDILRRNMSKKLVDEVLAQRPLNLLTWPEVAGDALVALCNHRAHPEMRTSELAALLSSRPAGWLARCGDLVAIVISQPLAAAFVRPVDPALVPGYAEVVLKPMDLSTVRRRLWSRRYQWHQQVMDDLRLVWSNAKVFNQENTDLWHAADCLEILTESLYEAWVLQPERRRDAESMREAGLGGMDDSSAAPGSEPKPESAEEGTGDATKGGVEVKQELAPPEPAVADAAAAEASVKSELAVEQPRQQQQQQGLTSNYAGGSRSSSSDNIIVISGATGLPVVVNGVDAVQEDDDNEGELNTAATTASAAAVAVFRRGRLPLDPATVHPSFAGRRTLPRHESPASGRSYGLWDPQSVHPAYFGHLRHDGEASGAAGIEGWTGAADGGAMDRALRVLRGATDSAAAGGEDIGRGDLAGVVRWSPEQRATVLGLLCEEAAMTGAAVEHVQGLLKKEAAVTQAAAGEIGGGGADGSASDELDEPFEAPGDDEAAVPEMELVPADDNVATALAAGGVGRACPLCGGIVKSGGSDLPGASGDSWVLVPPALKALPAKLLPRFLDLQRGQADVVATSPAEGVEVLSSSSRATWLWHLYRSRLASEDNRGVGRKESAKTSGASDDSGESDDSDGVAGDNGKGTPQRQREDREVVAAPETPSAVPLAPPRMDDNPFCARVAAHAGCVRKLWRARYLALREERRLRRREERTFAHPSFIFAAAGNRYDSYGRHRYSPPPAYGQWDVGAYTLQQQHLQPSQGVQTGQYPGQAFAGAGSPASHVGAPVPLAIAVAAPTAPAPVPTTGVHPAAAVAGATHPLPASARVAAPASVLRQGALTASDQATVAAAAASQVLGTTGGVPRPAARDSNSDGAQGNGNSNDAASATRAVGATAVGAPSTQAVAVMSMPITPVAAGHVSAEADTDSDMDEEEFAKEMQANLKGRDYSRNRPLGRDRFGNEYWRMFGDKHMVLVRRHGCWWGAYEGSEKIQELVRSLDVSTDGERHLRNRLHKAVDVWGVSERLGAYLRTKRAAKGRPETSAVAWGSVSRAVDGVGGVDDGGSGGTVASRKGKTAAGSSFLDERRREEADRIRGNLERASKPALWKRQHQVRETWLEGEMHELEEFLPVQAAGSGGTSGDFLFVQASVRQQRLFARALELRLGEYLETYDDERDSAIIEAYRAGDLEQLRVEKVRLKVELGDDSAANRDSQGWVRNTLPAAMREIAAETRALRLLHPPDLRTPAQKRKDMDAFAAGATSVASAAADAADAAVASERIAAREQARAALASAGAGAWHGSIPSADAAALGGPDVKLEGGGSEEAAGQAGTMVPAGAMATVASETSASSRLVNSSISSVRLEVAKDQGDGPASLGKRPESASLPGFDEDNPSAERSYWEPSVAGVGLVSAEMVKLKVEMLAVALCLPQRWELLHSAPSRGRARGRPRQRHITENAALVAPAPVAQELVPVAAVAVPEAAAGSIKRAEPASLPPVHFFAPSRGIAPELTAALKEAVEQQQTVYDEVEQDGTEAEDHIDIGMEDNSTAPVFDNGTPTPAAMEVDPSAGAVVGDTGNPAVETLPGSPDPAPAPAPAPAPVPTQESEPKPETEPVPDQPFVRKTQGKWLSVESSSDDEDFQDDDCAMAEVETTVNQAHASTQKAEAAEAAEAAGKPESLAIGPPVTADATPAFEGASPAAVAEGDEVWVTNEAATYHVAKAPGLSVAPPTAVHASAAVSSLAEVRTANETAPVEMAIDHAPLPSAPLPQAVNHVAIEGDGRPKIEPTPQQSELETPSDDAAVRPKRQEETPGVEISSMALDLDDWRERVRRAQTTEELASLALELDYALPREEGWLEPWYKTDSFPEPRLGGGSSLAAVATRVFALDRALRWNMIPRPCKGGSRLPGDLPRAWVFFYQCPLAPLCIRPCFHKGKCRFHRSGISRVDDPMVVPATPYRPLSHASNDEIVHSTTYGVASYGAASYGAPLYGATSYGSTSYGFVTSPTPAPATLSVVSHQSTTPVAQAPAPIPFVGGAVEPNASAPTAVAMTAVVSPYAAYSTTAASATAPTPRYHQAAPGPARTSDGGVAGAAVTTPSTARTATTSTSENARFAPQPVAVAPATAAAGVIPSTPNTGAVVPGINFAMPPGGGVAGLWAGLGHHHPPTPEQIRDFQAKAEAALREAWVAAVGAPQAAAAAAWAAANRATVVPASAATAPMTPMVQNPQPAGGATQVDENADSGGAGVAAGLDPAGLPTPR